jgi:hypothetical protein
MLNKTLKISENYKTMKAKIKCQCSIACYVPEHGRTQNATIAH